MDFEHMNTTPPADPVDTTNTGAPATDPITPVTPGSTEPAAPATPPATDPATEPAQPDLFIESINKRYGTQYKGDDEVKSVFGLPQKVVEYEKTIKEKEEFAKSVEEKYKKELEDLKSAGTSDLLSKPLIRKAYIADQLLSKYPDKDPFHLQEIVMADVDKMGDLDVLIKEQKIDFPNYSDEDHKAALLKTLGVDPDIDPKEWDSITKLTIEKAAKGARAKIKSLVSGVDFPKTVSKEERETLAAKALEEKVQAIAPIREQFKKFDTYTNGDFEFVVPDEYKAKLDDMFKGMFIDGKVEVNENTLRTAEMFKRNMFLEEYFPKIKEVIIKQAQTALKEQLDKELHNDKPLNTATATDQGATTDPSRPGVSEFFNTKEPLAKKI